MYPMSSSKVKGSEPPSCPCCRIFLSEANLFCGQVENGSSSPRSEKGGTSSPPATTTSTSKKNAGSAPSYSSNKDDATKSDDTLLVLPPLEAWKRLRSRSFLVDTHCHAHLERESSTLYYLHADEDTNATTEESLENDNFREGTERMISLSCAVEQADWESCLDYAAQSPYRVAALGIHPWYLDGIAKQQPEPDHGSWLQQLEQHLQRHAHIMIGEIGLCQHARFLRTYELGKAAALDLQRHVLVEQLALAVQYQRPVSIHCVHQQGVLLEILQQTYENCGKCLPPAIALHSFTGTAHHVEQLLKWEASVWEQCDVGTNHGRIPSASSSSSSLSPLLYFGFSHAVNYAMCSSTKSRRQGVRAIAAVPRHRVLAESDVHCTTDVAAGTAGAIAYLASALGESLESVADLTTRNGLAFLGSILQPDARASVTSVGDCDP